MPYCHILVEPIYSAISECQLLYPVPRTQTVREGEMVEEESGVYLSEGGEGDGKPY